MRYPEPEDKRWSALNPSIAVNNRDQYAVMIRSSNYFIHPKTGDTVLMWGRFIRTRTWFADVNPDQLTVSGLREVTYDLPEDLHNRRGFEDPRLFWREDGWHFFAVIWDPPEIPYSRLCLFRYDPETSVATFIEMLNAPRSIRSEKNWMAPSVATDKFDYNYSPTQVYKDGRIIGEGPDMEMSVRKTGTYLSTIRGGSGLLLQDDGTYLAIVHDVEVERENRYNVGTFGYEIVHHRNYTHYFARYSADGLLTHLTPGFLFKKPGIEFGAGMVEHGDDLIVSFGAVDVFAGFVRVPKTRVLDLLQEIEG